MKLVSFTRAGTASYGLVVEGGVVDAGAVLGDKYTNLRQILEADALAELQDLATRKADFSLEEIEFIPVIPEPQKTFCIGINYMTHIKEMNREKPEFPWVFTVSYTHLRAHET